MITQEFTGKKQNNMTTQEIENKYQEFCNTPSDINEHLPTLREYYDKCDHVTEFGVRGCVSLFAALASKAKKVVAYDIGNVWTPAIKKLTFICADDLQIEIEPTDALMVDTRHCYEQLIQELNLHAKNVRKWILCHDTNIFGEHGDDGGKGLNYALKEFLELNKEWREIYRTEKNNGLTIIEKK